MFHAFKVLEANTGHALPMHVQRATKKNSASGWARHLIDAHEGGHVGGLEQGQQAVVGDKAEDVGLLEAQ